LFFVAAAISTSAQTFTIVAYDGDGFTLISSLVQGRDGNLYGTQTDNDIANYYGSVFKVTSSGTLTVLHTFCPQLDCVAGAYPGPLMLGTDGNFYGVAGWGGITTGACGSSGCGTIFKMTTGGTVAVLHTFSGPDGIYPNGLIEGSDGNFYGTAANGGGSGSACGCGTIFKITPAGVFTTLHKFGGAGEGSSPTGLVQGVDGNLYGTTYGGGKYDPYSCQPYGGCGTVFKSTTGGAFTTLHSFQFTDGAVLYAPLAQASDGTFYGTTWEGPTGGTVFSITSRGEAKTVYDFSGIGANPIVGLIPASDGNLYGTLVEGGGDCGDGSIYSVSEAGVFATVYDSCQYGGYTSALVQGTSGKFYGSAGPSIYSLDTGLGAFVTFVVPGAKVGQTAQILGQGLTGATAVTFSGVAATKFTVVSDTYMTAAVPSGASTGPVVVATPGGALTSNVSFRVVN
jgi:uncharacterized repeat protein (TIGR03803 family)